MRSAISAAVSVICVLITTVSMAQQESTDSDIVASVNGRGIPQHLVDDVRRQLQTSGKPDDINQVIDELINLELLAQHAAALALDQSPAVASSLQLHRMQTLANAYLADRSTGLEFTDEELLREYERQLVQADIDEYRISHILVDSRAAASAVLDALEQGADFDSLAERESIDPSAQNGGDLGWFDSGSMDPAIVSVARELTVDEIAANPVETEFGFHIIKLTGKREKPVPDFATVKNQIREIVIRNSLADHVEQLREQADIRRRAD